jgi:hypothetical protein
MFCLASLIATAPGHAADSFGRLFFTPSQRNALDAGKSSGKSAPVALGPRTVYLNGVVTRSDSERTVWINGKAYHDGSPDSVQVKTNSATPGTTTIRVPGAGPAARVKVGQQLDVKSGKVRENYSRRAATDAAATDSSAPLPVIANKPGKMNDAAPAIDDKSREPPPPAR